MSLGFGFVSVFFVFKPFLGVSDAQDEKTNKSVIKLAGRRRLCKALPKEDETDGDDDPDLADFDSPGNFEILPDFRVFAKPNK